MAEQHEHYVRPADAGPPPSPVPARYTRWERLRRLLGSLVADRTPGEYNSLAPRTPDGGHTKLFSFNGNGKGR